MIAALGVSHKDAILAEQWLKWVAHLCNQPTGESHGHKLLVFCSAQVNKEQWRALVAACGEGPRMFSCACTWAADEHEVGYPAAASHLFLRTMEHCEQFYPGEPILWCEADTVPMRAGWFQEIAAEYDTCGKPFMGVVVKGHGFDHLGGNAVYPADWRVKAPLLANVLNAPDVFWGPGKGQAFDTYATPETLPQAHDAKTIQQIWRPPLPIRREWATENIRPETALFHQDKSGSLINVLRQGPIKREWKPE